MAETTGEVRLSVTDLAALEDNASRAAQAFCERWISLPSLVFPCEVMSLPELRNAMGLRATFNGGDPWPAVESYLLSHGFEWHYLGSQRVMYLRARADTIQVDVSDWQEAEE